MLIKNSLQDNKNRGIISGTSYVFLVVMYIIAYNNTFVSYSILWYGVSAITIFLLFAKVWTIQTAKKTIFYLIWAIVFLFYSGLGCLWAVDSLIVFDKMKTLLLMFAVNMLLFDVIQTKKDIEKILFANFIALLLVAFYIVLTMDMTQLGEDRIGVDTINEMWNANNIGLKMCIGFAISLYFLTKQRKLFEKIIYIASAVFFVFVALFTGSRKALLMIMALLVIFYWLKAKKHRILIFILACGVAVALYYLVMTVEPLYNVLGSRMEELVKGVFGGGTTEGSFNVREKMAQLGINWFWEKPFFGYGLGNYSMLYGALTGKYTYSHNNFVEMLVSGGLVGFIIYYSIYAFIFIKLLKSIFIKRDVLSIVLFSINIIALILQVGLVSYSSTLFNCFLMLAVSKINIKE